MTKRSRPGRKALTHHARIAKWIKDGKLEESASGCWLWTGILLPTGYATVGMSAKAFGDYEPGKRARVRLHRYMYMVHIGPIPEGLHLDHLCRVRHCCNPWHLDPVTRSVNMKRAVGNGSQWSSRTACSKGHEYTPESTRRNRDNSRTCRICERIWHKARRYGRREVAA